MSYPGVGDDSRHHQPSPPKISYVGLEYKLVSETLPLAGTSYVEMLAVMDKYLLSRKGQKILLFV